MGTQIFIRRKSDSTRQEGPFTQEEFLKMVDSGTVLFGDYAWKTGMANWVLAGSLALAFRPRAAGGDNLMPPGLAFGQRLPSDEAELRELFLRIDHVRVFPSIPDECAETTIPLTLLLSASSQLPGGKVWRRLATDLTRLFAARVRFEQAGLLHPHPVRLLLGEKSFDHELADDEIALLACEELKRRAVQLGADLLVDYRVRYEFVTDRSQAHEPTVSVIIVSAVAGMTAETAKARRARFARHKEEAAPAAPTEGASLDGLRAELAERERQLEEREAFLMDAEARLMNKIEEQQTKEVELAQREDNVRAMETAVQAKGQPLEKG